MGINTVNSNNNYKINRRKRNFYLFLLVFPAVLIVASFIFFYKTEYIEQNILLSIYLPLLLGLFALVIFIQPRVAFYGMYVDYSLLIHDELVAIPTEDRLYTSNWIEAMKRSGYTVVQDHVTHLLMYKFNKKLEGLGKSDKTLVFINIAKNEDFDFYSEEIDRAMQAVYLNNKEYEHIRRQITLQFKKFPTLNEKAKSEIESIILYNNAKQSIVNLTTAYIEDIQAIYAPFPKGKSPNRYAYYACNEIKRISSVKE